MILRGAGFQVSIATSAESALALLRSTDGFRLIITDHVLPGTNGAEFVRELRKVNTTTPVLVISGMPGLEEEYEGLDATVRQKPIPPPELIQLAHERLAE